MRSNDEKDISLTIGQSLRDSNGAIGVVEKIVNEFVFVRFPDGRHRIRRFSIGKEIFLIPEPESQPQRAIPIAPVISQKSQFSSIPQQLEGIKAVMIDTALIGKVLTERGIINSASIIRDTTEKALTRLDIIGQGMTVKAIIKKVLINSDTIRADTI